MKGRGLPPRGGARAESAGVGEAAVFPKWRVVAPSTKASALNVLSDEVQNDEWAGEEVGEDEA